MEDLMIASSEADARAMEAMVGHHTQMSDSLARKVDLLVTSARAGEPDATRDARDGLVQWCRDELVPHALAEETALYPAALALPKGRLLIEAMLAEHRLLVGLVDRVQRAADAVATAPTAVALQTLFDSHVAKENDQILPLLVATPDLSVADLLESMQAELTAAPASGVEAVESAGDTPCGCGEKDGADHPELDVRAVPHAIRHATVFGALDAVRPGKALVLIAPHDPVPLLRQLEGRAPGVFEVDYLQRGPDAWRLLLTRASA